jgi:hypothetical protein
MRLVTRFRRKNLSQKTRKNKEKGREKRKSKIEGEKERK